MNLTIIVSDSVVGIDGKFKKIDLSNIDKNIHAVQWNGDYGHIEYIDRRPNEIITSIDIFQDVIDKWNEPEVIYEPTPEEIEIIKEQMRLQAYRDEADPLYFKSQRGEIDKQVWLDKVAEIKLRYK